MYIAHSYRTCLKYKICVLILFNLLNQFIYNLEIILKDLHL